MKYVLYIVLIGILLSCGSSKNYSEQENQAFQNLKDMVMAKNFEIQSDFARPMVTNALMQLSNANILGPGATLVNVNIGSSSNHLTIKGDTISGFFPYFGEQRFGSGDPSGSHQGIEFKDVPDDYKIDVVENKRNVTISFNIDDTYRNNERYDVYITLFPNNKSSIQINSTNRTTIEYSGSVRPLKEDMMRED